ncbi:MAG: AraC family transcriptional regulator [Hyphomicrobiales bacterium]|nr:MAG: AraC family transcriptional regulator [Hyphomicrobiales bacterium]
MRQRDGEVNVQGHKQPRILDLRDKLTVLPPNHRLNGWMQLAKRTNQFSVTYINPVVVEAELDDEIRGKLKPMVHFENSGLRHTLEKLKTLGPSPGPLDAAYAENLALVAAIEIYRLQHADVPRVLPDRGQLTASQQRIIRDAIADPSGKNLSLSELAALAKLSRFHFARAFKKTFGMPPHQFILHHRIEAAKVSLIKDDVALSDLARSLGFGSQSRFSEVFRKATGLTPAQFRRRNR